MEHEMKCKECNTFIKYVDDEFLKARNIDTSSLLNCMCDKCIDEFIKEIKDENNKAIKESNKE